LFLLRPDLFNYDALVGQPNISNLDHAFNVAQDKLGIKKILDPLGKLKSNDFTGRFGYTEYSS